MDVLAQGYEPWESEFDASGRCISGCAYAGITLEDELAAMQRKTQQVVSELQATGQLPQKIDAVIEPVVSQPVMNTPLVIPVPTWQIVQAVSNMSDQVIQTNNVEVYGAPLGEPVAGKPPITSPFGRRKHPITGNLQNHSGVDLAVARGTPVVSPGAGTVANVWLDDTCGRGVRIKHGDGYETVYCHLDRAMVNIGDRVSAGYQIAVSGNTGRSTGPHLHYAIKKDGIYIDPVPLMGR
jgi:murein DD-endopeptidase MepM/ murein hydrolase activator NlpD